MHAKSRYFVELLSRPVCQRTMSFHTFLGMTFHVVRPWRKTKILREWEFFCSPRWNSRFEHGSVIVNNIFAYFTLSLSAPPGTHDQRKMLVLPNRLLHLSNFHIGLIFCFSPANYMSSAYTDKNNPFSRCANRHFQLETFSPPCFNRIFSNCLSNKSPAKGWPYRFRSRRTTGSSILDHDLGHLCRGRRIQMSGHSHWEFSTIWVHPPFYLV